MPLIIENVTRDAVDRRHDERGRIERLLKRAKYLSTPDRNLVEQVYFYGVPVKEIAREHNEPARNVRRRLAKLVKDLNAPLFSFVVTYGDRLPDPVRRTAELVVFQRHSLRQAASLSDQTLYQVREHINTIRALAEI